MSAPASGAAIPPALLLVHLRGICGNPVHSLGFAGKAFNAPLVALVISDDHVPARSLFIREGLHDRRFVRLRHAGNMRQDRLGCQRAVGWAKARSGAPTRFI